MASQGRPATGSMRSAVALPLILLSVLFASPRSATASTVAYWRFEEGPTNGAPVSHGGAGAGVFYPGTLDSSGNMNALSVWNETDAGHVYRTNRPLSVIPATGATNGFCVQNRGPWPCLFTQTGTALQTLTLPAFTIEASCLPLATNTWRTLVGRDSQGTYAGDTKLAALYLQITENNAVAIKFCDVSGRWHEALSAAGIITGFPAGNPAAGRWYHLAAVSDGTLLSLYLNSGAGYQRVAQTNMVLSGSPNRTLTAGGGDGGDWDAGNWSVGRGLYNGIHDNRAYGFIDEVRISDTALDARHFLFAAAAPQLVEDTTLSPPFAQWGQPVTVHAAFAGSLPLCYQWEMSADGVTYTNIPGATGTNLVLSGVQPADLGWYRLRAMNPYGTNTSAAARLEIRPVAWWRFEEGPSDAPVPHGGMANGVFYAGVADSSGNGNALSVWADGWAGYAFRADVPGYRVTGNGAANCFSVQNTDSWPGLFTQPGTALSALTPAAFTIEVSFKPETGGWRTLVGRDSRGAAGVNTNLSALYLQITPENAVAIKFCDVSGHWHEAVSASGLIQGFDYYSDPDGLTGRWYHLAAVSDGTELSLYLASAFGYGLVARTNLLLSGSGDTALTAGLGSGGDWSAGTWTVGRGLYAGAHTDRFYGFLDEVRITDRALAPREFLFWRPSILVTSTADSGPGTLREALALAADGDTIDATGLSGAITLTNGQLVVSQSVAILGPGPDALTVSGNHADRVFYVDGANVLISGLTVSNGYGYLESGGGIYNGSGTLTITDCTVKNNCTCFSDGGGGICNMNGTLVINGCMFNGNQWLAYVSDQGGGGAIYNRGALSSVSSTFSDNVSDDKGGGIYSVGTLSIDGCTFNGNTSFPGHSLFFEGGGAICCVGTNSIVNSSFSGNSGFCGGGAIYCDGTSSVASSLFSENSSMYGGGIFNFGALSIASSTFSGNSTGDGDGGGIFNYGYFSTSTLHIAACTFNGNLTAYWGGGICNSAYYGAAKLEISNTILDGGTQTASISTNGPGCTVVSAGFNLSTDGGGGFLTATGDQTHTDPKLGPLQDNGGPTWTHALLPGSPAIDAGDDALAALQPTDQRGLPRKFGAHVDIGAYEARWPAVTPPLLTGLGRSGGGTFHVAFSNAPGALFTVLTTTNLAVPAANWTVLPSSLVTEDPPGFYQFADPSATNDPQRFYRVRWP